MSFSNAKLVNTPVNFSLPKVNETTISHINSSELNDDGNKFLKILTCKLDELNENKDKLETIKDKLEEINELQSDINDLKSDVLTLMKSLDMK